MRFYFKRFNRKRVRVYPLGDFHYGSPQCNVAFVKQVVQEVRADPEAVWVGMGDFMENAIVGSKSDVYTQTDSPEDQAKFIARLLDPIKKKGLFMVGGNHEQRSHREVGMAPEELISAELGRNPKTGERWVPYVGFSCLATLHLEPTKNPKGFTCYFHHNRGGGYTHGGKVNRAARLRDIVPTVDATFSAHFHTTSRIPITWFEAGRKKILKKLGYDYITGAALEYADSYGEEKAARPAVCEFIKVTLEGNTNGRKDGRRQIYEVIVPKEE